MRWFFAIMALATAPAWANGEFPALYDVAGVAADDHLNVRAAPSTRAAEIAQLSPDARNIEVMGRAFAEGWVRINTGEGVGFVAARFLIRQPGQEPWDLPQVTQCFGTEPFWALGFGGEGLTFSVPGQEPVILGQGSPKTSVNHPGRYWISAAADGRMLEARLTRAECSDGMSDRLYGIEFDMLFSDAPDQSVVLSGCCTVAPR